MTKSLSRAGIAIVAAATLALTACSNSESDSKDKVDTATSAAATAASKAESAVKDATNADTKDITFEQAFVKAKPAEKNMTGIFGTLKNSSDKDVTLEGFTTNLNAGKYEVHEVVNGVMQLKPGGIVIPAKGEYILKPGGDHLMIMDIDDPIAAGDMVKVTLNFSDGTKLETGEIPVRTIGSGEENYGANGGVEGNSGMSMAPSASMQH